MKKMTKSFGKDGQFKIVVELQDNFEYYIVEEFYKNKIVKTHSVSRGLNNLVKAINAIEIELQSIIQGMYEEYDKLEELGFVFEK